MKIPLADSRNATRMLAERLDELSGLAAVLMAHAAHITDELFSEDDFRKVQAAAQRMVRDPIGHSSLADPKRHATENAELLWSMIQNLRANRALE